MDAQQHSLRLVEGYRVVLASNSPRRKELLGGLGIDFEVRTLQDIDESFPDTLEGKEIPCISRERRLRHTNRRWQTMR